MAIAIEVRMRRFFFRGSWVHFAGGHLAVWGWGSSLYSIAGNAAGAGGGGGGGTGLRFGMPVGGWVCGSGVDIFKGSMFSTSGVGGGYVEL